MLNHIPPIASAARFSGCLLASLLAAIAVPQCCYAQIEPLPAVSSEFGYTALPLNQAPPNLGEPTVVPGASPPEQVWTPYGDAAVSKRDGFAVEDPNAPP